MKYLSVCSGIEAATVAWHHMGWQAVGYSEIEAFPASVLRRHYPSVINYGDMTRYEEWDVEPFRLLVGGTPCQSFSVAGLRKGLHDPRGGLMLTFLEIAQRHQPRWVVWENVPGVLSSNGGWDFGSFLGALGELGYGWAYRILDAQWFGVAQRRRRVFVVGCLGGQINAAKVLFESESVRRDNPPIREKRQTAPTIPSRSTAGGGLGTDFDCDGGLIAYSASGVGYWREGIGPLRAREQDSHESVVCMAHGQGGRPEGAAGGHFVIDVCPTLRAGGNRTGGNRPPGTDVDTADSLICMSFSLGRNSGQEHVVAVNTQVRRLTPTECERLQGFPDGYTDIPWRGKLEAPDGLRYKALGNSMAVPVMRWIGERINIAEYNLPNLLI